MVEEVSNKNEKVESKPRKKILIVSVIVIIIAIVGVYVFVVNPSTSLLSSIHDGDGDGIPDQDDDFPDDSELSTDTDGDGYADENDAFPYNASEWKDTDGDGYGDNSDAFPNLASEHVDSDLDGVGDNSDAFPSDSTQQTDRDGDGYGDNPLGSNPDKFPDNPNEWTDSDSDGVGDNADFYDQGNGKIRIAISRYQGDGSADALSPGDPYFKILIDTNSDGITDLTYTSQVFQDDELISNPYSITFDLPDYITSFKFSIEVWDSDLDGDDPIDYVPSSAGYSYTHTVLAPYSNSWTYDGSDDMQGGQIDCELSYSISVVS